MRGGCGCGCSVDRAAGAGAFGVREGGEVAERGGGADEDVAVEFGGREGGVGGCLCAGGFGRAGCCGGGDGGVGAAAA